MIKYRVLIFEIDVLLYDIDVEFYVGFDVKFFYCEEEVELLGKDIMKLEFNEVIREFEFLW